MDQFVTTYRKDYLWPYVRTFGMKPDFGSGDRFGTLCKCQCQHEDYGKVQGPNVLNQESFQRPGPNAPLMDPKLYPARVGPAPENNSQRVNQPNIFLEKLRLKYPFLYEVLRTAPPDDIISRINKDRLRTTYQVDYLHLNEYPSAPYDELLRAAGVAGVSPCSEPIRLPGDPCRPKEKPLGLAPGLNRRTKPYAGNELRCGVQGGPGAMGGAFGGGEGALLQVPGSSMPTGSTEYRDAFSKLGELIIRDKIHHRRIK